MRETSQSDQDRSSLAFLLDMSLTFQDASGNTTQAAKILTIDVKPGWKEGTKITFEREGDEAPGVVPADLIFVLRQRPHEFFTRENDDLHCTLSVTLVQALTGMKLSIPHLDGHEVVVQVTEVVTPDYKKIVAGEGMPITRQPGVRGNLVINFNVVWPTSLTEQQKEQAKALFRNVTWRSPVM